MSFNSEEGDSYLSALELCSNRVFPAVLNAAIDLNLFDIIAKASSSDANMSASEMASQLIPNQHPELARRLERILPLLVSYSLLTCSTRMHEDGRTERVYALSSIGKHFARDDDGCTISYFTTLLHRGLDDLWKNLNNAILDSDNSTHFQKVYGMPMYEYMETNKKLSHIFDKSMANSGTIDIKRILKIYKGFEGISTLVEVGGGIGHGLKLIISKYPSIKGINFDLPQVVENAPPYPGIEHVGGDMYAGVPKGDAFILKAVLHNWSDENCIKLLSNCHKALPPNGKVIVLDLIMPDALNSSTASKMVSLIDNLMLITTGGKERTEKEFEKLGRSSGFSRFHVACNDSSAMSGVMEFYK